MGLTIGHFGPMTQGKETERQIDTGIVVNGGEFEANNGTTHFDGLEPRSCLSTLVLYPWWEPNKLMGPNLVSPRSPQ